MPPKTITFDIKKAIKSSWGAFLAFGILIVIALVNMALYKPVYYIMLEIIIVMVIALIWQLLMWRGYKKYVIEMTEEDIRIVGCGRRIVGMKKEKVDDISLRWEQVQKVAMKSLYTTDGNRYTIDWLYTTEMPNIWKDITAYYNEIKTK